MQGRSQWSRNSRHYMYILPVDEATYTSQHCNYQRSLTDIDTQAMITSPQWLHLDGHIYDIERTQSSSPSNECITRSRVGRLKNMIQMRCSLTSLNFVYQTAKITCTPGRIATSSSSANTFEAFRACACQQRSECTRRSACRGRPR